MSVFYHSRPRHTGDVVLVRGLGMVVFPVSVHSLHLVSDSLNGAVRMGVHAELPVDVIFGNGLAGDQVWTKGPLPI